MLACLNGDVFPITPLGKLLTSLTAILSIGLIAMPTGILAAAFSDAVQRHRRTLDSEADAMKAKAERRRT